MKKILLNDQPFDNKIPKPQPGPTLYQPLKFLTKIEKKF